MKNIEYLEHTADIGIVVYGRGIKELYENAAYGMFSLITNLEHIKEEEEIKIDTEGVDKESLLVNWLNDLLYEFAAVRVIFKKFKINEMTETNLTATCKGEKIKPEIHKFNLEIKSATYNMLTIEKKNDIYKATIVFDV